MIPGTGFDGLLEGLLEPLRNSGLPLSIADATAPDLPLVSINDAFTDLTGYREADCIGRNCRFLQGPATDRAAIARLRAALAAGASVREVLLNYRRDGSPFMNELLVMPVRDAGGRLRFFAGVQRAVAAARGAGRRFRFARLPDGTLRELPGADGLPPGWLAALDAGQRRRLVHAASGGRTLNLRLSLPEGFADPRHLELRAEGRPWPDGVVFDGIAEPLPPQETSLAGRLRLLEAASRHANDVVVITEAEPLDLPGPRIVFVNEAIRAHTGHEPGAVIGHTPRILQGAQTDHAATARLGAALRRWESPTVQLLNYRSDGSTFWNEVSISPVADETGWYTHWISIQRDVSERRQVQERIAHLAAHDSLTGIPNRATAMTRLDLAIAAAQAQGSRVGLIRLDLDRFKMVNDTHGHAAGDALLAEVARRLQAGLRAGDTTARVGGDEFVAILPGIAGREALAAAADRLLAAVEGSFAWNGQRLDISLSGGAALFPDDAEDAETLLAVADTTLYRAKKLGRGRVEQAWPGLREEGRERARIACDIRRGLEAGEFEPFFQPQVSLADGRLVGLEALVRWRHASRGVLSPGDFLDIAEEAGLLGALGDLMLEAGLGAAARWVKAGTAFGTLAINLTGDQLRHPDLAGRIADALARHGVPAPRLTVEVVENVFVNDRSGRVEANLAALRRLGIGIELDDFGTGFASLTHLRRFPVDRLKIDRSFVADIGVDPDDEVIIAAVVQMAGSLGLGSVAEGVETEAQAAHLRRIGCRDMQGFLVARPMDAAATEAWMAAYGKRDAPARRPQAR
jgi:diguanylate cyclase (GGDEF)-like protein/PAS domain S-box-containing protein